MEKTLVAIAHAAKDEQGEWRAPHDLEAHLFGVATLAADFAKTFGPEWAELAGRWHDLGKYRPRFQHYIRRASGFEADFHADAHITGEDSPGKPGKAPHSTAGALLALERFGTAGRTLAYLIAGHHAGLDDWHGGLEVRLALPASQQELDDALAQKPPAALFDMAHFKPDLRQIPGGKDGFALWVRLLFSCLVDADFLDTEAYISPENANERGAWPDISDLLVQFNRHMTELAQKLSRQGPLSPVNRLRADILAQCRAKAAEAPGLFSLTVPTGGGKTLSGMAFALEHARLHSKRRVIYVIPYTSIIEQTADIFRSLFGDAVIEHHSNAEVAPDQESLQSRLACENWNAPLIVTTNVQFFESLFAARTSRCRKLHNIVNSVVILDEAQLLPPEFLQPILDALRLLTTHYGVSVVLSTATQPALASSHYFDARQNLRGLENVREIMADPDALYRALERVNVHLPSDLHSPTPWETLAEELNRFDSVLAIVNRRNDARELWRRMPGDTLHLSALMCGAHRSQIIANIKIRLQTGSPTRVISTQLVEAGVDVDFPVVYRALAGLDSIAQAAGRCNREGRLEKGEMRVFIPPDGALPDMIQRGINATFSVVHSTTTLKKSPLKRENFSRYFSHFYYQTDLDKHQIGEALKMNGTLDRELAINFRTAAERFRLIADEDRAPVIVLYRGPAGDDPTIDQCLTQLRKEGPKRWLMRKLQRYTVSLHRREIQALLAQDDIAELMPGLFVQISDWLYHPTLGLTPEGIPPTPTSVIA